MLKRSLGLVASLLFSCSVSAQAPSPLVGRWEGSLELGPRSLTIVLNINYDGERYQALLDSPDQGGFGIPGEVENISRTSVLVSVPSLGAAYQADLKRDTLSGVFSQAGMEFPLEMHRRDQSVKAARLRPQEPTPPYPYTVEHVSFKNLDDGVRLAATLTRPTVEALKGKVVLVSGSGPQNRDEEIAGHKPFWVIADYLSRHGYAVLRYDDRGTAASGGDFASASMSTLTEDARSALRYLRAQASLDGLPAGIIGHSEGAFIAGKIAGDYEHNLVDFSVMLAGPGIPGAELYREQVEALIRAEGEGELKTTQRLSIIDQVIELLLATPLDKNIDRELRPLVERLGALSGVVSKELVEQYIQAYSSTTLREVLRIDPSVAFAGIKGPVLALIGENDLQVLPDSNLSGLRSIFDRNEHAALTAHRLPNLNHLFQTSETGHPFEYAKITETFAPAALKILLKWLDQTTQMLVSEQQ